MEILITIAKFFVSPLIALLMVTGYATPTQDEYSSLVEVATQENLAGTVANTVAGFETSLASSITDTDTTITLVSFTTDDGTDLTAGKEYAFTIDEGSSIREFIIGTASTSNMLVDVVRGISVVDGVTEVTANKKDHRRGASVKITNFQLVTITNILNDTETIPAPLRYESSVATTSLTSPQHLSSKAYVDYVAFSGAGVIDANETAKGVVELATQIEQASSTETGGSGPLVLQSKYSTSTGGLAGLWTVVTGNLGYISESFFGGTWDNPYTHEATTTFNGAVFFASSTKVRVYEVDDSWIKPPQFSYIEIEVVGGGGNGGAGDTANGAGGGGGGGGYSKEILFPSDLSGTSSVAILVGSSTESSSFSTFLSATGGSTGGVTGAGANGGSGGGGSGGNININGQGGASGSNGTVSLGSGLGGNSFYGGGAPGVYTGAGIDGTSYGGGGSGGHDNVLGGTGGSGVVIVTEYFN